MFKKNRLVLCSLLVLSGLLSGCGSNNDDGDSVAESRQQEQAAGQDAFRFETFGNEGFWTDAAKLPQGIVAAKLTPVQALKAGLSVNVEQLDAATATAVADELKKYGANGPLLNDPATTIKLLNANAVIGVVVRDTNNDGVLDAASGDKVGVSCALCHAITDGSVLNLPKGGSIGVAQDGRAVHNINIGAIFALAQNTRALYPMARLKGADGKSIGKNPGYPGLTKNSSEAAFDAYFANPSNYPIGSFDDTVDGNGNPMHNTPLFQQDLAAPFGSAGELDRFDQFANTVFTVLLDPTNLVSEGGRAFLKAAAGPAGVQLANDYAEVLADTGVTNYPYIQVASRGAPGTQDHLIGIAVDQGRLQQMTAYVNALRSPPGVVKNEASVARGKEVFLSAQASCTTCHNADNSQPVPSNVVDMSVIFPGDAPVILGEREAPITGPVSNTPGNTFDDKMIVVNATLRGANRGAALPLLMDLERKPVFLHDNSISSLNRLFTSRGANAPHPFYIQNAGDRKDLVRYLESLDDTSK